MIHRDAVGWKHATTLNSRSHGEPVGVDLFDDELNATGESTITIYSRFQDGTRFPARTVTPRSDNPAYHTDVLAAWSRHGEVHDYRHAIA